MTDIKTWQQAMDYTFKTRHSWRHGNGSKTARINCNHFTRLRGASFPLGKINQPNITGVCIELEDEGKSDATINRVVSAISTVLNHCAFDGLIDTAPRFRRRKESEGRVLWYTKEEVSQMAYLSTEVFMREDLRDIINFAAFTGMRQGEILKLRAMDIDWVDNKIHVGGMPEVQTKAANWRVIPIHDHIGEALRRRCDGVQPRVRIFGDEWRDKDQLRRSFEKVRKLAGKEDSYVFHTLRHSFATWHADAGTPIRTLMALMGHKRIETTLRYAKATNSALSEAMAAI